MAFGAYFLRKWVRAIVSLWAGIWLGSTRAFVDWWIVTDSRRWQENVTFATHAHALAKARRSTLEHLKNSTL